MFLPFKAQVFPFPSPSHLCSWFDALPTTPPPTEPSVAVPKAAGNLKRQTTRRPAANAQLNSITSGDEFSLQDVQDVEDEDDICDSDLPAGDPSDRSPVLAPHKPPVTTTKTAVDIIYFFTEIDFPNATKDNKKTQKVCKLCIKIYGTNKSKVPRSVANYFYSKNTGNSNLRCHLSKQHTKVYDDAISKYGWSYKLSTQSEDPSRHQNNRKLRNQDIPSFSPGSFLDHLVRFIVADDQSIRVIECPEFRQLCMVLRETLVDANIPGRDKMREAIITRWQTSFEKLKHDLSVF
ncbi:hypothetical protein EDB85DRAFT_2156756 [Lactarius pseudohatsudake]|nr:hypothetical protein EDB85DRAFT_2156756 [Lactarius pseudohatsudake]